tara:strand:- start:326 stop:481 length:156 start_codon:yes stop_codon:yes gene_type:complete
MRLGLPEPYNTCHEQDTGQEIDDPINDCGCPTAWQIKNRVSYTKPNLDILD